METLFHLVIEFFKIGLFSIGGGYATIPFLYQIIHTYGWYSVQDLTNMLAVSVITPGPVGVNMATFAGFNTLKEQHILLGILGGILATISIILPSYLAIIFISKLLKKYRDNLWVNIILSSLKPAGCGLICAVCLGLIKDNITNLISFLLLLTLFGLSFFFKKNPLYYFIIASIISIFLKIFHLI